MLACHHLLAESSGFVTCISATENNKNKNKVMPGPVVVWSESICDKIQLKYLIQ